MDRATIRPAIRVLITEIHSRLSEAVRGSKAAEACALAGIVAECVLTGNLLERTLNGPGGSPHTRMSVGEIAKTRPEVQRKLANAPTGAFFRRDPYECRATTFS